MKKTQVIVRITTRAGVKYITVLIDNNCSCPLSQAMANVRYRLRKEGDTFTTVDAAW